MSHAMATAHKTAIVTGATRGIGRATAIALGRRGYHVVVTGRTVHEGDAAKRPEADALPELKLVSGSLESTVAAIEAAGGRATPLVLDLLDRDRLGPVAVEAIAALGQVDVLLNNAIYVGPAGEKRFLDTPPDELEKRLFGNITAQLLFIQPVLAHMVAKQAGIIANVTSGAGFARPFAPIGEGGWALSYGVSKAGLHRIAAQLVVEHARDGVRFFNLQPGAVATERVLAAGAKLEFVAKHAAPVDIVGEAIARILDGSPAPDTGEPFANGTSIEVQDVAREWGLLPAR
jgi:NAD(P)-dependent dehydrogenase (short-subunit alcohol dehydrogenase family)